MPKLPLTVRISIVVFLCFAAIGALVLRYSYSAEQNRILSKLDQSIERVLPALASPAARGAARALLKEGRANARYPITGLMFERGYGRIEHIGSTEKLVDVTANDSGALKYLDDGRVLYDRLYHFTPAGETLELKAWVRIDATVISADKSEHIMDVFWQMLVTTIFVTAITVLALHPILLLPLKRLRELINTTREKGLASVHVPPAALNRSDELGDLYRAFEDMRKGLSRAEDKQNQLAAQFKGFADLGADCFWEVDRHFRFRFIAGNVESIFGATKEELLGRSFMAMAQAGELPVCEPASCVMHLRNEGSWQGEINVPGGNDDKRSVRIVARLLINEDGAVTGVRGTVTDTTVASNLKRAIAHQETHDRITGLTNRAEFERQLNRKLSVLPSVRKPACVLVLNIDRFKVINDACGHTAGDQLLQEVAEIAKQNIRDGDLLARRDGDTFSLLIDQCSLDEGIAIAENIRTSAERHKFLWKNEAFPISVSIGLAPIDRDVGRKENVLLNADAACYKAKETGRNQIRCYDADDQVQLRRHDDAQWVTQIHQAIQENRLVLFYQPIAPLTMNKPGYVHLEVLVRMQTRDGQILPPGAFLPAAERYDQIEAIDKWVVSNVLRWLEEQNPPRDKDLVVCVNLSGSSAADPTFQKYLTDAIMAANVNPRHLCFEMTETSAIHNLADTAVFLEQMRTLGCLIALDDFGTGFSSLEYIKQLPLDFIKIDGAFIRDIASNKLDQALVRCVSDVARILEVKTVAEFVEDAETMRVLHELDIDLAQGYFIAKPTPLPGYPELVKRAAMHANEQSGVVAKISTPA